MPLRKLPVACLWLAALLASTALGYEGEQHQQLTFLAAKHFNQCVADTDIPRLTPLQVRYMARSNVRQAERNLFSRMFNWRYYDRGGQKSRSLLWLIDTRFHDHFRDVQKRLERSSPAAPPAERYSDLGSLIGYIQLVTSPAHAVPVYTTRWWRFSVSDRFDDYPVDNAAVEAALGDDCDFLAFGALRFQQILTSTADDTLAAVRAPIAGLPTTWQAFWQPDRDDDDFGEYGPAGNNFGRATRFRCGDGGEQECVLLDDDPLYAAFALARHLSAVRGSMHAMRLLQQSLELEFANAD